MSTPLQSTNLTADEVTAPILTEHASDMVEGEEGHIHLPNPSFWPILLTIAIAVTVGGLIFWSNGSFPWLSVIAAPFVLVGIIGWGVEDPMAPIGRQAPTEGLARTYEEAAETGKPTALAQMVLENAEDVVDRTVTISSTEWSAHPVKVFVEREGVVLSLYGKVELEAQKQELEDNLRRLPGVIDVMNFIVAEDAILNAANARIASLKESGKLEGAKDISVLVENYIVSLYGEVPKPEMKYMLEREMIGIPGVRVVVNHIGLNEDIPGNLGKTANRVGP